MTAGYSGTPQAKKLGIKPGLPTLVPALGERIFPAGSLWIAWPRKATGHVSDLTDNVVREAVLPLGLVDVKVAAIDDDWSGLKIVWRVENRGGTEIF